MVPDPLHAFARGFLLRYIVVQARARAHHGGDERVGVDEPALGYHGYPAGGSHVDVDVPGLGGPGTKTYERQVSAAPEDRRAGGQAQFGCRGRQEGTYDIRRGYDFGHVSGIDAELSAERIAPRAKTVRREAARPRVVEERGVGRVRRHGHAARRPGDEVLLGVQPFMDARERLSLVLRDPTVLPDRILGARRNASGDEQ